MNKHTHRLVFDRRRGMRVPAAEHARSAGKAAGGQTRAAVAVGVLSLIALSDCAQAQTRADSGAAAATSRFSSVNWGGARMAADVAAALNRARPNLPTYTADGNWKLNTGAYTDPTYSADGRIMTLVQNGKTIVLNWDTFDISKGYELRFVQNVGDRAFNRVYDVNPSVIDGGLSGRGEIVIENRNGVVFGPNARVQAGSLVATALQLTNEAFEKNFRNFRDYTAAFGGVESDNKGFIGIEAGAEIKSLAGGDVIMVAPRIVNKGLIETPQGQAILAAGKTVYLYAQTDLAQRGLMVAVDSFAADPEQTDLGTVVNQLVMEDGKEKGGVVQADKGTINLVGAAIRQKGRLTATTAVKGQNGAIYLQAMESTYDGKAPSKSGEVGSGENAQGKAKLAKKLGVIELAEGSVTEVLPSADGMVLNAQGQLVVQDAPKEPDALKADASAADKVAYEQAKARYDAELTAYKAVTQQASDTFYRSRIDIIGADITLRSGSKVIAPAGEINILAAEDWQGSVLYNDAASLVRDNSLIRMESGAVVDASGLDNVRLPGSRHQLKGRLFSIELADSPLQRGGVLYRSELLADARRNISVGDVSGLYANWRYTAAELSTVGGIVRLQAQGFLDLMPGAKVDFSGGSVVYEATSITSSLLANAARPNSYTRIEDADAGTFFSAFLSDPSRATTSELARFGLSADAVVGNNVPEIKVGQNAGAALLAAPSMRVDAALDGSVVMNEQQRVSKTTSGLRTGYEQGVFVMGNALSEWTDASHAITWDPALTKSPNLYTSLRPNAGTLVIGNEIGGVSNGLPNAEMVAGVRISASGGSGMNEAGEFVMSAATLQQAGLGALNVMANTVSLGGEDGSMASLRLAPGGRVDVRAYDHVSINGALVAQGGDMDIAALTGDIKVTKGSLLSVAGVARDERFESAPANEAVDVTAGTLKLSAQGIDLQGVLDVSAGAWRAKAGGFRAGDAGTLEMVVNANRQDASAPLVHTLTLGDGFNLFGFDFDSGATIKVSGLPAIVIGDRFEHAVADNAFRLDVQALAGNGFGTQTFAAIGDVTVGQGASVVPVLSNLIQDQARYSQVSLARVDSLPAGKRSGVQLSLTASAEPAIEGGSPVGLEQGADVLVEKGARIDVGAGGSISLKAGGSIDVSGELVARGGKLALSLSGKRGSTPGDISDTEQVGYVSGQHIALHDGALLDVSGVVKSYRPDGQDLKVADDKVRVFGEVLGGGSITIGTADGSATRGRFISELGSLMKLDGANGYLDFGRTIDKRFVAAGAGTLTIGVTDGFELLGGLSAQAGHASVAGGTVKVVLTQSRLVDRASVSPYPTGDEAGLRTIHLMATSKEAATYAADKLKFGEGVLSSNALLSAGFERISLRADHSMDLHENAHLVSVSDRGPLQSVVLDAPLIKLVDEQTHLVRANHVGIGQFSAATVTRAPLADATKGSAVGEQGGLVGEGVLAVSAGLIEVSGDVGIQGAKLTILDATLDRQGGNTRTNGEVRFIGAREYDSKDLKGQLSYSGWLNVRAGQVYATTLSDFDVVGFDGAKGLNLFTLLSPEKGSTSQAPLSALASLSIKADTVYLDGLIRQPFGGIDVSAQTLEVGANARLSVSGLNNDGSDLLVPVGTTVNQTQWVYATQGAVASTGLTETLDADTNKTLIDLSKRSVDKHVALNGQTLSMTDSTLVDGRAGGDLVAWEFKAGVGGSTDTYNRAGVYAILPGYSFDFAPYDADIHASSAKLGKGLNVGDQVTVTTGSNVLAAGTYTLLDARYGILPGAVLVQATSVNTTQALSKAIANDDGSVIVSGFMGSTGTARNSGSPKLALKLEPEATYRAQSEVIRTGGNAYIDQLAERTGDSLRRAGDGARVSFVANEAFDLMAQVRLGGRQGLRAGVLDLAMPDLIVSDVPLKNADGSANLQVVNLSALGTTGAESILLGGTRELTSDGWKVTRLADTVRIAGQADKGTTLETAGELLAVAKGSVRVDDGVTVSSTGADNGDSRRYLIQGDGAALLVGNLVDTEVTVQGVSDAPSGDLILGRASIEGRAVQLDATGALRVSPEAKVAASSLGLGAQRLAVGASADDQLKDGVLNLSGQLLTDVNGSQRLQLRAYQGIDLYRDVTLGSSTMDKLTLDTPLLRGVGTANQVAHVLAREVVLSNRTGRTAVSETGGSQVKIEATPVRRDGRTGGLTVGASASSDSSLAANGQHLAFVNAVLASQGDVIFDQRGKLSSQGDLRIEAARVTATTESDQTVAAGGTLVVSKADGASTLGESLGAGGALTLSGQRVEQRGVVDIESGKLTVQGTGQAGRDDTVVFAQGSTTSVKGRVRQVSETLTVASHGGTIRAQADAGQIRVNGVLDASAPVMPTGTAGSSGTATDAGVIVLKATGARGAVVMGDTGQLRLEAVSGGQGGTLQVDARRVITAAQAQAEAEGAQQSASQIDALVKAAATGSTTQAQHRVDVRVREGDVLLNTQLRSHNVQLTADGGKLELGVSANVIADAEQGGLVQLQSQGDLTLQHGAKISARSTREGANGGDVLLSSTDGRVKLGDATVVADSAGDALDGRIVIRAGRDGSDIAVDRLPDDGQAGTQLKLQAGQVEMVGVKVYESTTRKTLIKGEQTDDAWGLKTLQSEADDYASQANRAAMLGRLGLSGSSVSVKAEAEIRAAGNFTLSTEDLNFEPDSGKLPMNLTVRAGGDLSVTGNVSAGFGSAVKVVPAATAPSPMSTGDASSFRFVAGADTGSANLLAVKDDSTKGHFELAGDKHIRTTAGSIEVAAAGDIRLLSTSVANTTSAIYVAGRLANLAAGEASAGDFKWAQHTEHGGRLSISAGHDLLSLFPSKDKDTGVVTLKPQALTQLTTNYFFHAGTNASEVSWWTAFDSFRQGLGSFGGGNLLVKAGHDIGDMPVVSLTNAQSVKLSSGTTELRIRGGGDVEIVAGGDISGGLFVLGRGDGHVTAGGALTTGASYASKPKSSGYTSTTDILSMGALFGLMDGTWSVKANGDIAVSHVFNPTILPMPVTKGTEGVNDAAESRTSKLVTNGVADRSLAGYFFTYGEGAGIVMTSTTGDISWQADNDSLENIQLLNRSRYAAETITDTTVHGYLSQAANLAPSVIVANSLNGSVSIDAAGTRLSDSERANWKPILVMPSDTSDVRLYAALDISLSGNIQVLDWSQSEFLTSSSSQPLGSRSYGAQNKNTGKSSLMDSINASSAWGRRLGTGYSALVDGNDTTLTGSAGASDRGALNDNVIRLIAGRDVVFSAVRASETEQMRASLRVNRPAEIAAGRDLITPTFLGQNFAEDDVTRLSAGRDVIGGNVDTGAIVISGPGQLRVEAGRDVLLQQSSGIAAIGNSVNQALPDQGAKITVEAGMAREVDLPQATQRYGSDAAFRAELRAAVVASQLPPPAGRASWADASDAEVEATFATLTDTHQVAALQRYLDARFVARYLPELAGHDAAYYRSDEFQRRKHEAMWQLAQALTSEAAGIAGSDNAAEEARRQARRQALYEQAAAVVDLAGLGDSFDRSGLVNLADARVHNLAPGGGNTFSLIDNSLGGIDVIAADSVLVGLPSKDGKAHGFVNFSGGSFRSLTGGDFLAGDQKVIVAGRGNLYIYSTDGDIDSGKGSNNVVSQVVPRRVFNSLTGKVETKGQPPLSGSGFQSILNPADVTPVVGLYAPKGEIRALDAFIVGKVELAAPLVKGADNIAGQPPSGGGTPAVSVNITPKLGNTQAGLEQASEAGNERKQASEDGKLSVELLGMGAEGEAAATASGNPDRCKEPAEGDGKASGGAPAKPGSAAPDKPCPR